MQIFAPIHLEIMLVKVDLPPKALLHQWEKTVANLHFYIDGLHHRFSLPREIVHAAL